jgi:hypothetical protein
VSRRRSTRRCTARCGELTACLAMSCPASRRR